MRLKYLNQVISNWDRVTQEPKGRESHLVRVALWYPGDNIENWKLPVFYLSVLWPTFYIPVIMCTRNRYQKTSEKMHDLSGQIADSNAWVLFCSSACVWCLCPNWFMFIMGKFPVVITSKGSRFLMVEKWIFWKVLLVVFCELFKMPVRYNIVNIA